MQIENIADARTDLLGIVRQLRRAPKRRATPFWSLPSELWLLLLDPACWEQFRGGGVGADLLPATSTAFTE
eukprot:4032522-Pyramimonas_sp.AAC.1